MIAAGDLAIIGLAAVSAPTGDEVRGPVLEATSLVAANDTKQRHQLRVRRQVLQPQQRTDILGLIRRQGEIAVDRSLEQRTQIEGAADEIGRRRVGKECRSRWSPYH